MSIELEQNRTRRRKARAAVAPACALLLCLAAAVRGEEAANTARLRLLSRIEPGVGGAEIIDYDAERALLVSTLSGGVAVVSLENPAAPIAVRTVRFSDADLPAGGGGLDGVSSVATDPVGRGFAAAALIPRKTAAGRGSVVFFRLETGEILASLPVGFHPDAVAFSHDGRFALIANEGEYRRRGAQTEGSLTVVDLSGVDETNDVKSLDPSSATTYPFAPEYFGTGASPEGLRRHDAESAPTLAHSLEPEYVSEAGGRVYVSLQENNALAVFDLGQRKWLRFFDLGTIRQRIDASDRDGAFGGAAAKIDDEVAGLPMPDTIKAFMWDGKPCVITANEGDARAGDSGDAMRIKHAGRAGPPLDPAVRRRLKTALGADPLMDHALGRLEISTVDGDIDGDGDIDVPTMFGTRSISVWDGETGERLFDSGSFFEEYALARDPQTFNMNRGNPERRDTRSDNKGPEIEAVAVAEWDGTLWYAAAAERQNGLFLFRAEQPDRPELYAYANPRGAGDTAPECLRFVPAEERKDGRTLLIAGFEASETILIFEIDGTN